MILVFSTTKNSAAHGDTTRARSPICAAVPIDTLRHQQGVLGSVASPPTAWRALDELTSASLKRVATAKAKTRARVWDLIRGGVPASKVAGTVLPADVIVLDVDATIVPVHSEKENAAATFKRTFGYHPLAVWCDCDDSRVPSRGRV